MYDTCLYVEFLHEHDPVVGIEFKWKFKISIFSDFEEKKLKKPNDFQRKI